MQRELERAFSQPTAEDLPGALQSLRREVEELRRRLDEGEPPASLEGWFALKASGPQRITLKEIAQHTGYSYGYVRRKHAAYRGGQARNKR